LSPDHLVDLVCFVYLVDWFIWLVSFNQKPDKPDKPNNGLLMLADFFSIQLVLSGGIVTGVDAHSS